MTAATGVSLASLKPGGKILDVAAQPATQRHLREAALRMSKETSTASIAGKGFMRGTPPDNATATTP
ncbi:hypothetical protein [Ensifer sp. MJa1]|uniref:hypothetical protein n=1 Tax=Ensifer sp. MJa1 TaxID=2919888 RepID=UPI00300BA464